MNNLIPTQFEIEGLIISEFFARFRMGEVYPKSKFKVGNIVKYIGTKWSELNNKLFIVTGVGLSEDYEYSLGGFPYLVWELELEAGFYTCKYCGTSNESINNCKKCGAPPNIKE